MESDGFAPVTLTDINVAAEVQQRIEVKLHVAAKREEIQVTDDSASNGISPAQNSTGGITERMPTTVTVRSDLNHTTMVGGLVQLESKG
jgi:hypothetical protein